MVCLIFQCQKTLTSPENFPNNSKNITHQSFLAYLFSLFCCGTYRTYLRKMLFVRIEIFYLVTTKMITTAVLLLNKATFTLN